MTVIVAGVEIPSTRVVLTTSPVPQTDITRFRYWHVEPMLNQSADLLDRVLSTQSTYDRLRSEWYQARQALIETDLVQLRTEALKGYGALDQDVMLLNAELNSRESILSNYKAASELIDSSQAAIPNESGRDAAHARAEADQHQLWAAEKVYVAAMETKDIQKKWLLIIRDTHRPFC